MMIDLSALSHLIFGKENSSSTDGNCGQIVLIVQQTDFLFKSCLVFAHLDQLANLSNCAFLSTVFFQM